MTGHTIIPFQIMTTNLSQRLTYLELFDFIGTDVLPVKRSPLLYGSIENPDSIPIHLDDLRCLGTETFLTDCMDNFFQSTHVCNHSEDAGVHCGGEIPMDLCTHDIIPKI